MKTVALVSVVALLCCLDVALSLPQPQPVADTSLKLPLYQNNVADTQQGIIILCFTTL